MSRQDWKVCKLTELGFLGRGRSRNRPRNEPSLYGGIYPFVQTGDIKAAELYLYEYSQTYNEKGLAQSKLWKPETLMITIAANIAETAILGIEACFPDSVVGFIADPLKSDVRYIKYYIDFIKAQMQSISLGTTQDNLSMEKLQTIDFLVPPPEEQRKIAAVLSAYDELIENNNRRIAILEEMAQNLYQEWFVRFKYPGHEGVPVVESELGLIPAGWEVKSLAEVSKLQSGYAFKSEQFTNTPTTSVVVRMGNFKINNGLQFDTNTKYLKEGIKVKEQYHLTSGDLLIVLSDVTRTGSIIGNVGVVPDDGYTYLLNQRVSKINLFNKTHFYYFYGLLTAEAFKIYCLSRADSVTVLNLSNQDYYEYKIFFPPENIIQEFSEKYASFQKLIALLERTNKNLRQSRDLFLPRLISGELDLSELEIVGSN